MYPKKYRKIQTRNFHHRLRITIDTTIRGFLSVQISVAVVFIFQKYYSKQGSLRLFDRWSISIWFFIHNQTSNFREKLASKILVRSVSPSSRKFVTLLGRVSLYCCQKCIFTTKTSLVALAEKNYIVIFGFSDL
jgi:hypothetical protein